MTPLKRVINTAAKMLVTGALLAWVLLKVDQRAVIRALGNIPVQWIVLCLGIVVSLSAVQTLRWRIIAGAIHRPWAFRPAWGIVLMGIFFSQCLPTSIGGDVVRIWKVHQAGMPLGKAFNSVALERLMSVLAILLIVVLGSSVLNELLTVPLARGVVWLGIAAIGSGFAVLLFIDRVPIPGALAHMRIIRTLRGMTRDAAVLFSTARAAAQAMALSVCMQVALSAVIWILANGAGASVGFVQCNVLVPIVILVSVLPFSIAGWGLREGGMVVAFGLLGVDPSVAVSVSVIFGLILLASGIPGSVIWLYTRQGAVHGAPARGDQPSRS